jgi:hypothetical protein
MMSVSRFAFAVGIVGGCKKWWWMLHIDGGGLLVVYPLEAR